MPTDTSEKSFEARSFRSLEEVGYPTGCPGFSPPTPCDLASNQALDVGYCLSARDRRTEPEAPVDLAGPGLIPPC